jgi:predicted phage terminase large subunit-like protein
MKDLPELWQWLTPRERDEINHSLGIGPGPFASWLPIVSPEWCWTWPHLTELIKHLDRLIYGDIEYLLVTMPPRHGKSECATVRWTSWAIERDPSLPVILGAYNQELANSFSRKMQRILAGRVEMDTSHTEVKDWETAKRGGLRAVGVGSGVTGRGGRLIVIDDPVKSREEAESEAYRRRVWDWYTNDLYTRREPGCRMLLIQTRWHEDDLAGRILEQDKGVGEWTVVNLPAIAEDEGDPLGRGIGEALCPDRYDVGALSGIRRVIGEYAWSSLYQQRPSPPGGAILKRHWWRYWYPADGPVPPPVMVRMEDGTMQACQQMALPALQTQAYSLDCAFGDEDHHDWVVGGIWGQRGPDRFLLDQIRGHWGMEETVKQSLDILQRHPKARVRYVEAKANGMAVIKALRRKLTGVIPIEPMGGKIARVRAIEPEVESGNVYLPHPSIAPWVDGFVEEAASFPNGKHDDQVDQMSQYLAQAAKHEFTLPADGPVPADEQNEATHRSLLEKLAPDTLEDYEEPDWTLERMIGVGVKDILGVQ